MHVLLRERDGNPISAERIINTEANIARNQLLQEWLFNPEVNCELHTRISKIVE